MKVINSLILEYLQYNNYEHSANVFAPEANIKKDYDRRKIAQKLDINQDYETQKLPLLYSKIFNQVFVLDKNDNYLNLKLHIFYI